MDTTITVYKVPSCTQCVMTTRALDASELEYETVDLSVDAAALERMRDLGYTQAPIVIDETTGASWTGFRPDLIADLATALEHEQVASC